MDRLKNIKIEYEDGSLSDNIPISADAANVYMADGKNLEAKVKELLEEIHYSPVSISSFTNNVNTVEMGSTITSVTLNWAINKTPSSLLLDDSNIDIELRTKTFSGQNITTNKTYTLKAIDSKDASSTKTTSITFYNGVYYGVAENKTSFDSVFVRNLTKSLQSNTVKTFTITAGANQYIYYATPSRYGKPIFSVGGFEGGFQKVLTFNFTNASGYSENYDVYKSENANLGATTVVVN